MSPSLVNSAVSSVYTTKIDNKHHKTSYFYASWFSNCWTCTKWNNVASDFIQEVPLGVHLRAVLNYKQMATSVIVNQRQLLVSQRCFVVLYADDILTMAPSVCNLKQLVNACQVELDLLDMQVNFRKSSCMHIGPRCSVKCDNIVLTSGQSLRWVDQLRYLGVFIVRFVKFKCSLNHAKRNFYRSSNSIFGKVGRAASEKVVLHLIKTKCLPVLLYGPEVCSLTKADQRSLTLQSYVF